MIVVHIFDEKSNMTFGTVESSENRVTHFGIKFNCHIGQVKYMTNDIFDYFVRFVGNFFSNLTFFFLIIVNIDFT